MHRHILVLWLLFVLSPDSSAASATLQVAYFEADASPPVGSPMFYQLNEEVLMPLSARGVVLLGSGQPIVLCAVDWIGIADSAHTEWRNVLAEAAGTSPARVAVHTLHQHDAPGADFDAEAILAEHGLAGKRFDNHFIRQTMSRVAEAIQATLQAPQTVTHLGTGAGRVEKIASNRRVIGADGLIQYWRGSTTNDPDARAAPEGTIDPLVRSISFFHDDRPLVVLSYYATHPMSYYLMAKAHPDFVGMAREQREQALGVPHVYFTGAGGNIAAGKYNDGSHENRQIFADRLAAGMQLAWESNKITPISATDVAWHHEDVALPLADNLDEVKLIETLDDKNVRPWDRYKAACCLAWIHRCQAGGKVSLGCLHLARVRSLHLCGELFVEYQLAAQQLRPDDFVAVAAYGDYGTGYIGLRDSYPQGGYEVQPRVSLVSPDVEDVLMSSISRLLNNQTE